MELFYAVVLAVLLFAGCNKPAAPQARTETADQPQEGRSATKDVIYTMTQFDKMETGRRAKERIRTAADAHNKDLDEVSIDDP